MRGSQQQWHSGRCLGSLPGSWGLFFECFLLGLDFFVVIDDLFFLLQVAILKNMLFTFYINQANFEVRRD